MEYENILRKTMLEELEFKCRGGQQHSKMYWLERHLYTVLTERKIE